ncbi:MAG TPA: DNA polymerase III subunit alpha, partial [Planctomycetota bacterium]|nr:DNA polymerase III subunit alpha [Planctomycetota bacterium]
MGFASYFLIVWDLRRFAIQNGMRVGPGRGSAAGSLVSYLLDITLVDPLRYGLIFERFLNPSRKEMPDIDLDFSDEDRGRIIEYIFERYGRDKVAQIITYGTLKARAVLRDVGRVLGIDLKRVDQLAKKIPKVLDITLHDAARMEPEIQKEIDQDPQVKELWEISLRLEGNARHAGKHASGVVICDRSLEEIVPLYTLDEAVMTQYDMNAITKLGILKIDILGLETLTVLDRATKLIEQVQGIKIDLGKIPLDDKDTYAMLGRGTVKGVFQLETSRGMRELVQKMKPDRIDDLIATIALFRPGPLQSGMVESYIRCKHRLEPIKSLHPSIDPILAETNGVILYQEQVMRIANVMAGFSMADADGLRKAMGKKIPEIMAKYKEQFVTGAVKAGVKEETAIQVFDLMAFFAGYGFNKCVIGATLIVDARTGERTTVEDLYRNRRPFWVHALGEDGRLRPREVVDVLGNGPKPIYEVRTAQGRKISATGNHPFRTLEGWKNLEELCPGERIASPRALPAGAVETWPQHELVTLAGLLSEGNGCHPSGLYFTGRLAPLAEDFVRAVEQFPNSAAKVSACGDGSLEVWVRTGEDTSSQPANRSRYLARNGGSVALAAPVHCGAFQWAQQLGVVGMRAAERRVPSEVLVLCDADLALFLGRLWSGDGWVSNDEQPVPCYATSSQSLAVDVQHLLLRLGIVSGIHEHPPSSRGGSRAGFTVHVAGEVGARRFLRRITPHCVGREVEAEHLRRYLETTAEDPPHDSLPAEIRKWVDEERRKRGLTWRQVEESTGVSTEEFEGKGSALKQGVRRSSILKLGDFFGCRRLREAACSDVFWDRVASIESKGVVETYDLTVEGDHNFVADGLIVHNSHSAAYGFISYQTAYLKSKWPVEYMAAGMSVAMGDTDKLASYIEECRQLGIEVLPPDINTSNLDFTVTEKKIRFGLGAVKGAGEK